MRVLTFRTQMFKLLVVRNTGNNTFTRPATRTVNIYFLSTDDYIEEEGVNSDGVIAISALREVRLLSRIYLLLKLALYYFIGVVCYTTLLYFFDVPSQTLQILKYALKFLGILFTVLYIYVPSTLIVCDKIGHIIDLQTGVTNLNGGCTIL